MGLTDRYGLPLSTSSEKAAIYYQEALDRASKLSTGVNDLSKLRTYATKIVQSELLHHPRERRRTQIGDHVAQAEWVEEPLPSLGLFA